MKILPKKSLLPLRYHHQINYTKSHINFYYKNLDFIPIFIKKKVFIVFNNDSIKILLQKEISSPSSISSSP